MIRRASIQNALLFFMFATSWQRDSPPVAMAGVDAFMITQSTSETVACRSRTANKDLRRQPVVEMLKARSQCNNVFVERRQQSHQFCVDWAYTRRKMVSTPVVPPSSSQPQTERPQWNEKKKELVLKFVSNVQESITDGSFVSLTIRGVKKQPTNKNSNVVDLRGCIRQIQGRLVQVAKQGLMLQLTIKYHGATDIAKNWKVDDGTDDGVEISTKLADLILDPSSANGVIASEWGDEAIQSQAIQGAELTKLNHVYDLQLSSKLKKPKLVKRKLKTKQPQQHPSGQPGSSVILSHDRVKQVPLSNQSKFLQVLGITNKDGKPRPGMKSKLRQCQKFVEIVGGLVDKQMNSKQQQLPQDQSISVIDMGCGRGYLTFSLHSYLCEQYSSCNGGDPANDIGAIKVSSCGIDVRPKLVKEISDIATSLGGHFNTLTFEEGTIEDIVRQRGVAENKIDDDDVESSSLDVLIALHACDTATDDALWSAVCQKVDIIVVAPCCHKQIRPQINSYFAQSSSKNPQELHPLTDVLRHGVYRERISETVTDSLRALLLEWAGYRTQVFEFIGGEHTSKNVMITAVRQQKIDSPTQGAGSRLDIEERINNLASFHGVRQQKLANWMGVKLGEDDAIGGGSGNFKSRISPKKMPPLSK